MFFPDVWRIAHVVVFFRHYSTDTPPRLLADAAGSNNNFMRSHATPPYTYTYTAGGGAGGGAGAAPPVTSAQTTTPTARSRTTPPPAKIDALSCGVPRPPLPAESAVLRSRCSAVSSLLGIWKRFSSPSSAVGMRGRQHHAARALSEIRRVSSISQILRSTNGISPPPSPRP